MKQAQQAQMDQSVQRVAGVELTEGFRGLVARPHCLSEHHHCFVVVTLY
jgi:hypothetical protein